MDGYRNMGHSLFRETEVGVRNESDAEKNLGGLIAVASATVAYIPVAIMDTAYMPLWCRVMVAWPSKGHRWGEDRAQNLM